MTGFLILTIFGMASAGLFPGEHPPSPIYTPPQFPAVEPIYTTTPVEQDCDQVWNVQTNGMVTFDKHACIFRHGDVYARGCELEVGEDGSFEIERSSATTETGEHVNVEDGLVHVRRLNPRNRAAISEALARVSRALGNYNAMTIEEFIQLIGGAPLSTHLGVFVVTAGVITINGVYRNINAGVLVIVTHSGGEEPSVGPVFPTLSSGYLQPAVETVTIVVTEIAYPQTEVVYQSVTLIKTTTIDDFITITSPVYRSIDITFTNWVKRTVTVPEAQVIRSPLAGSIEVHTAAVPTRIYITVTDTTTNFFVQTGHNTITNTLVHFSTAFSFNTVTSNFPVTSTVTQTITRTSVATTFTTNTLVTTLYVTTTEFITLDAQEPAPGVGGPGFGGPGFGPKPAPGFGPKPAPGFGAPIATPVYGGL